MARAGPIAVVFDGTLTDRHELVALSSDASAPADDAKVILEAYRRVGEGLLSRISGAFALVLWDSEKGRLLCARDPIGIHPLYYTDDGSTLAVASFVEPLLRHLAGNPSVDPVAATMRILGLPLRPEQTPFAAVQRVLPGHALDVSPTGTRLFRYWDPGEPGSEEGLTPNEAAERFEALLRQAVDRCVGTDAAAVYLSGGIDSASVAAVTTEVTSEKQLSPPLGLSLVVEHRDLDEASNQRAVVADLAMELVPTSIEEAVGSGRLLRATLEVSASGSAGPADIIQPIYDFLAREGIRRGRGAFLSGQGGDEWLLPSRVYGADCLRTFDLPALYRLWQACYHYLPFQSNASFARQALWTWGAQPLVRAAALHAGRSVARVRDLLARRVLERFPSWLAPNAALRQEIVERVLSADAPDSSVAVSYRNGRRALLDRPDRPGITEEAFATRQRLGVRTLMPLLDADVVRFLYRLPPDLLVNGGRAKALARDVVAKRLPSFGQGWPRTVSGDRYYGRLIEQEAPLAWRDAGGTPFLAELGVVDESELERLVQLESSPRGIWSATNMDVWLRSVSARSRSEQPTGLGAHPEGSTLETRPR